MPSLADKAAFARHYIEQLSGVLGTLPFEELAKVLQILEDAQREGRTVFLAGNGGSAATASHMANDLMKTIVKKKSGNGLRAISLSDNAQLVTAIANDDGYEHVFADQLQVLGCSGDILILISGSGNSPNVVRAAEIAREKKLSSIAFLGMDGGRVKTLVDIAVIVPSNEYGPIEDVHLIFNHLITAYFCEKK